MQRAFLIRNGFALALLASVASANAEQLPDFTQLVEKSAPAVVNVEATTSDTAASAQGDIDDQDIPEIFKRFFGPGGRPPHGGGSGERHSLGSGFIISADGYVLTNNHVVDGADEILIKLSDRRELDAKVIGTDKESDVALLKVNATGLPTVPIGDSGKLRPGQWVVAIGSPFGLDHSITHGVVSYVGRSNGGAEQQYVPFIQTDVPINRGNSGGPLFDLAGKVVGINSQIFSTSGGAMGLSFSIPINLAMDAVHQLKTKGYVSRGMIGVSVQNVSEGIAKSKGLSDAQGALVAQMQPDGPAAKAGLKVGDVITSFDGKKIYESAQLPPVVAMTAPGTEANVGVVRDGKPMTFKVKIAEMPRNGLSQEFIANAPAASSGSSLLGLTVQDITAGMRQQLGYSGQGGVVVTDVEGAAARAGLSPGDVILRVGNKPVNGVSEFRRETANVKAGSTVLLLVSRQGQNQFVAISVPEK